MTLSPTALAQYDRPKLIALLQHAQERIQVLEAEVDQLRHVQARNHELEIETGQLRQQIKWRDQLDAVPGTVMSQNQKAALKVTLQGIQHKAPDADGLVQIESWHLCKKAGMSKGTFLDHLAYCAELGILRKRTEQVRDPDSQQVIATNYFVGTTELTAYPYKYQAPQPRTHGGARPRCKNPTCRSERLQKRTIKRTIITCLDCGEVQSEETDDQTVMPSGHLDRQFDHAADSSIMESTQEPQSEPDMSSQNVDSPAYKTNVLNSQLDVLALLPPEPTTPPIGVEVDHDKPHQAQTMSQADILAQAAQLLVEIAGLELVHVEMSARGPDKYYPVRRALTMQDALAHLNGRKTKGASLRHPDGMTRALCYDADHADTWEHLLDAARFLAEAGYQVLVEDSPAGRGGHLWIIYTGLVKATWAHRHALEVAPMLHSIKEAWLGTHRNNVRLPGGKYVKPGFAVWCRLHDAHGARLAENGREAARALLTFQTPVEIVPAYPEPQAVQPGDEPARLPNDTDQAQDSNTSPVAPHKTAGVDQYWQQKYSPHLWFHFSPAMLAAWYNERHKVQDLLPAEQNGRGLATWRGERTASVGLREDGWVDFGASARREDGKQDGGDALELTVRLSGEPKPDVMCELGRQLKSEACEALERAAQRGEQPPPWVQTFMSPAGWQHYRQLREEAGHSDQAITEPAPHIGGGVDFASPDHDAPASQTRPGQEQQHLQCAVQGIPSSNPMQAMAMLEAIKDYGQAAAWTALLLDGEEIIPAGRSNWLQFVWLSHNKEQQRRVYEYVRERSQP